MAVIEPDTKQEIKDGEERRDSTKETSVDETETANESKEEELLKQKQGDLLDQANEAKTEGNQLFVAGQFDDALSKYELALYYAPEMPSSLELRSICHSNRAVCFLKQGKYEEAVKESTNALELNATNLRALIRRGEAHEKLEHFDESIADMKKILELDPANEQARVTIRRLEPLAAEKREKMKDEVLGKLKEMRNSLLGRFGMNLDNLVKDPKTGSYSFTSQR